jgi:hypothetical protein
MKFTNQDVNALAVWITDGLISPRNDENVMREDWFNTYLTIVQRIQTWPLNG